MKEQVMGVLRTFAVLAGRWFAVLVVLGGVAALILPDRLGRVS
jgi:hypothetical protein